jgi:hypothetical protein
MKIYLEEGYSARDAAVKIITKNLYGLEIDQRAFPTSIVFSNDESQTIQQKNFKKC